ncbi:MAG: hypothetical protein A2Y40_09740 [Candidatus Margulisbacteria bacterium GWF2_35_9]|nr:MAG: hypothetical protein A2Y40_09740 [Candidatus Margulisbacteria bacterium GWF2_35_9]
MFNIVLYEPEIPPNTGNIARLCLATNSTLHLVKPIGFSLDDKHLKRAGLDYWEHVDIKTYDSFDMLYSKNSSSRFYYLTTKTNRPYTDVKFTAGDYLVFGPESRGLPEKYVRSDQAITIPMFSDKVRSINLATAVSIVLYEGIRQIT